MGFNPEFKKPDITHNYIRFRQYSPKAGENYRTSPAIDKHDTKVIFATPKQHKVGGMKTIIHPPMRHHLQNPKWNVLDG